MKLRLSSSLLLLALTNTAFAHNCPTEKFYVGAFGGGGSSHHFDASQYGTAFFVEVAGGPLAVNAFGEINHHSSPFYGLQLGYQAPATLLTSQWKLAPAFELEGYAMKRKSFSGELINNNARLPEHDFLVSYPMKRNVFLANMVLNFDNACILVHPYIGFGIGSAIASISDATATQISPPEAGINHYNSNSSDTNATFAGQIKLGLSYDINDYLSLFADYRWLYVGNTHFVFGSTVVPGHAETSSWQVNLNAQRYNLGSAGIRFNW
ncbi:outer membrane beta-barrel protein [Candidatus Berkiella aquae]|uniref:Outer membrane beta-barrel protein n=1 Tax=Candidatus Berkiella aquae TaxID=295108 RepID=A0A0Q9YP57_9GAMM|nr:outer membrane beta-barrel protein [Candidatus Berkiella aquae]MCS5712079.1 outer membrane beta-barrel protein [Candidatus Berkiella aquae]